MNYKRLPVWLLCLSCQCNFAVGLNWSVIPGHTCAVEGHDVHMPWKYELQETEHPPAIRWHRGTPSNGDLMAIYVFGEPQLRVYGTYRPDRVTFDPKDTESDRVNKGNASLILHRVKRSDNGPLSAMLQGLLPMEQRSELTVVSSSEDLGNCTVCAGAHCVKDDQSGQLTVTQGQEVTLTFTKAPELACNISVDVTRRDSHPVNCLEGSSCNLGVVSFTSENETTSLELDIEYKQHGYILYRVPKIYSFTETRDDSLNKVCSEPRFWMAATGFLAAVLVAYVAVTAVYIGKLRRNDREGPFKPEPLLKSRLTV